MHRTPEACSAFYRTVSYRRCRQAIEFAENFLGGFGPDKRLGVTAVIADGATNGIFQFGNGFEDAATDALRVMMVKKPSTALRQDADVGVKWKTQRGLSASHCLTLGFLWVA